MEFKELTEELALGELKNTSIPSKEDGGQIKSEHRSMIRNHTNKGLVALYSRFILSEKEVLLRTQRPTTHYFLRPEFSRTSDAVVPYKYIDDTEGNPFDDDVIKILTVYDTNGEELYLDDVEQEYSLFTPQYDCLQIPEVHVGTMFAVIYQASHTKITGTDPCQKIRLPLFLYEALQSYIASKVISQMNGEEHAAKGLEYMNRYDSICAEAELRNLVTTSKTTTSTKLHKRGYV